jgi:prepilin-type processing-associated H-X9-DG protein
VYQCPSETGSRTGADGNVLSGDGEEGITYFDGFRKGSSYAINRNLSPGPSQDGLYTPRKGYFNDAFRPDLFGYTPPYGPAVYNRTLDPVLMDIHDQGTGWAPSWFESTMDYAAVANPLDYYFLPSGPTGGIQYKYAFRHANETANLWYLDGHVQGKRSMIYTGQTVYVPLFEGN